MYTSFQVRNFRCFRELTIADLEQVNLIAGVNNVGKTALLEAFFLHCGAYNPALALKVNAFRGIEAMKIELGQWAESPWDSLFHNFDLSQAIELTGKNTLTGKRVLRLRVLHRPAELAKVAQVILCAPSDSQRLFDYEESKESLGASEIAKVLELEYWEGERHGSYYMILDQKGARIEPIPLAPPFPAFFQAARARISFKEEAERFGKLEIRREQDVILQVLQLIEPRLKRLTVVVVAGEPMLHGDIGTGRLIPLPIMGGGMTRLASLVIHIGNAPNGVVLVDEIENGLHHSILPKVWRAIGEVARQFNTQVFATTHSLECIMAAHKAFSESGLYDFRLHRLEHTRETIRAVTYDQEILEAAIETGLEVR
ncbi:MAG TPA: ATP-binding protein [Desulfobacterales bacterium]|nr:ATP-binding protein [Desulfobacterales bacterium]